MMKTKKTWSKKRITLLLFSGAIVLIAGLWMWTQIAPRPLGDRLTYIGKKDFGGWFMKPYARYYYKTNMNQEELKSYFSQATYKSSDNILSSPELQGKDMWFTSALGDFIVSHYDNPDAALKAVDLSSSNIENVVSITSSDYEVAKGSL